MAVCSIAIVAGVLGVVVLVKGLMFRRRFGGHHGFGGFGGHHGFGGGPPWAYAGACGGRRFGGGGCGRSSHDDYGYDYDRGSDRGSRGGGGGGWRGWGGKSYWLRALFYRLDTTPSQEREIKAAIEEFQKVASEAKSNVKLAREDLARAMGSESFDEIAIGEANVKADNAALQIKGALETSLKRVHAALDPKQRERLAELISKGPSFGRKGWGPYRDSAF